MSRPSTTAGALQIDAAPARVTSKDRTRSLRRLAGWVASVMADDGFSDRFAAERRSDENLVRRVERQRHS